MKAQRFLRVSTWVRLLCGTPCEGALEGCGSGCLAQEAHGEGTFSLILSQTFSLISCLHCLASGGASVLPCALGVGGCPESLGGLASAGPRGSGLRHTRCHAHLANPGPASPSKRLLFRLLHATEPAQLGVASTGLLRGVAQAQCASGVGVLGCRCFQGSL